MRNRLGLIAYTLAMGYETMDRRVYSLESLRNELSAAHKSLGTFIEELNVAITHEKDPVQESFTVCHCELCCAFRDKAYSTMKG